MGLAAGLDERVVEAALIEDVGTGDVTTERVVSADATCEARLLLGEPGVVCGLSVAKAVFRRLAPAVQLDALVEEGERVDAPSVLARVEGPARAILSGERTALNFVGRLSGIATLTRSYVDAVEGTRVVVLDTRKTTPGLRALEKYAVRCGGGTNHRFGLDESVLIKDNHLRLAGGIHTAVERARGAGDIPIEVEAETLDDVAEALAAGADRILLDNMSAETIHEAVKLVGGRTELEASGGITLGNVRAFAEAGVDFVSVGALTRSARSLDVSLEVT
jgi:nicotinate-nucleotide pyrophosphorylase (carboxylating)